MKAFVLTDKALQRHAGRFVWLSIDTEKEVNAPFLEKYPIEAWPTLLVIDPAPERVVVRHLGAPTVSQLELLLADAERALAATGDSPDALFAQANREAAERDHAAAAELAKKALHIAPEGWPSRPRALEFLVYALERAGQGEGCLEVARAAGQELPRGLPRAAIASLGMSCAMDLGRAEAVAELRTIVEDALRPPPIEMSADDKSSFYDVLVYERGERGDEAGRKQLAAEWAAHLEQAAASARTPQERTVFDSHRLSAYLVLGTLEKLIPVLQQHERELPDDFNPAARLSFVYRELGRLDEALAANDRALPKAPGPRRLRILRDRSEIFVAMNKPEEAKRTLREALAHFASLPEPQQHEGTRAAIEKRLAELQ